MYSFNLLLNLSSAIIQESRIIFAPCGPKPFTLINLIVTLNLNLNSVVWRISQGKNQLPVDRKAIGYISVIELLKNKSKPALNNMYDSISTPSS